MTGYTMEEVFELADSKILTDKENYLLSWLTASPEKMRCCNIEADRRFEAVLSVLQRERKKNVIPFRNPRLKK